jgi:hypothetical protein
MKFYNQEKINVENKNKISADEINLTELINYMYNSIETIDNIIIKNIKNIKSKKRNYFKIFFPFDFNKITEEENDFIFFVCNLFISNMAYDKELKREKRLGVPDRFAYLTRYLSNSSILKIINYENFNINTFKPSLIRKCLYLYIR